MKILKADVLGMCFGVRDALGLIDQLEQPERVTIHGELVHNERVLEQLTQHGFHQAAEGQRTALPVTDLVLVTAHGISDRERRRLEDAGKTLVDSTCPLVLRAHEAAQKLQQEGCHVLVIGRRGHVEVQGIIEDLNSFDVLQTTEDVQRFPYAKLGVMCQTTTPVAHAEAMRRAIVEHNPQADIRFADTICHPTKDHQKALEKLLDDAQAVVVVGGKNSNNTRQLVERCRERGVPAYHVQSATDLQTRWFTGLEVVGLTAGTSTLAETIEEVYQALLHLGPR